MKRTYDYDDVLIVPQSSCVNSRDETDINVKIRDLTLYTPIIASPMKGIVGKELIAAMWHYGGIGILHRFHDNVWDALKDIEWLSKQKVVFGIAVGMEYNPSYIENSLTLGAKIICLDVANGYTDDVLLMTSKLACNYGANALIMSGCVATSRGATQLYNYGANIIRVGIGTGALCTTRSVTGIGYGQVSSLLECKGNGCIAADGGINTSGKAVKAFAAGADVVVMGSWFAQTLESAHNGLIYGMASRRLQEEYYHSVKSVEGTEATAQKVTPLKEMIYEFTYGIRSAMTYVGAHNLQELRDMAEFVEI